MVCDPGQIGRGGFEGRGGRRFAIEEDVLKEVAAATGGEYYRAEDAERLTQVLLDLPRDVTLQTRQEEVTAWFVAGGALLVLGGVGLSVWLNRPRRAVSAI